MTDQVVVGYDGTERGDDALGLGVACARILRWAGRRRGVSLTCADRDRTRRRGMGDRSAPIRRVLLGGVSGSLIGRAKMPVIVVPRGG
ncbi:MAG TPA: hypothetical protein VIQ02_14470 [Jiangellaceae bacterium]|jgi:nucleotide-binding universal stress UspA family protein